MVQVGDAIWQRRSGAAWFRGAVRPVRVIEVFVLAQEGHQVALVPDQSPVPRRHPQRIAVCCVKTQVRSVVAEFWNPQGDAIIAMLLVVPLLGAQGPPVKSGFRHH